MVAICVAAVIPLLPRKKFGVGYKYYILLYIIIYIILKNIYIIS